MLLASRVGLGIVMCLLWQSTSNFACLFLSSHVFTGHRALGQIVEFYDAIGYTDTVTVFAYCIKIESLSMYVMAACVFTLQRSLFHGRPEPFWAPRLHPYLCSALQVLLATDASADQAPTIKYILQPHSSAAAGHECLCVCASCLCLSVCPGKPICVTATSRHRLQDRFYLSFFIIQAVQELVVTAVRAVTGDASFHLLYGSAANPASDNTAADSPSMPTASATATMAAPRRSGRQHKPTAE